MPAPAIVAGFCALAGAACNALVNEKDIIDQRPDNLSKDDVEKAAAAMSQQKADDIAAIRLIKELDDDGVKANTINQWHDAVKQLSEASTHFDNLRSEWIMKELKRLGYVSDYSGVKP